DSALRRFAQQPLGLPKEPFSFRQVNDAARRHGVRCNCRLLSSVARRVSAPHRALSPILRYVIARSYSQISGVALPLLSCTSRAGSAAGRLMADLESASTCGRPDVAAYATKLLAAMRAEATTRRR